MESAKPDKGEKKIIWINVVIGAFLMVATLPGRTQGLGLITEPLLAELSISSLGREHHGRGESGGEKQRFRHGGVFAAP